ACRYCEQYCPVFPAMERRLTFATADLAYLANLCHNCGECLYACQYAPPHEFNIDVPRTLSKVRVESYESCAWPSFAAGANHNRPRQGYGGPPKLYAKAEGSRDGGTGRRQATRDVLTLKHLHATG